jgi:MFS family permease
MVFVEAAFGSYMGIWPLWIEELGAPITVVGFVIGSAGLLRLGALGPAAGLAERFGVRRTIMVARLAAGLGMLAAAVATHWTQLFAMVIGAAIGEAAFPLAQHHVVAAAGAKRVRTFTLVFTVGPSIALLVSPLVSGALVAAFGMRAAFLLAAACTAASVACFAGIAPTATPDEEEARPRSTFRDALSEPRVRRILGLHFVTICVLALGTSLVPTFLADERGLSPAVITVIGAGAAVGSTLFGLLVARSPGIQRVPFVAIGFAVGAVALALATFAWTSSLPIIAAGYLLRGGFFSSWALFVAALGEVVTAGHRARAFAAAEMLGGAAFSFAPMLAGQLYARNPVLPLLSSVALAVALVPVLLRTQRTIGRLPGQVAPAPAPAEVA